MCLSVTVSPSLELLNPGQESITSYPARHLNANAREERLLFLHKYFSKGANCIGYLYLGQVISDFHFPLGMERDRFKPAREEVLVVSCLSLGGLEVSR